MLLLDRLLRNGFNPHSGAVSSTELSNKREHQGGDLPSGPFWSFLVILFLSRVGQTKRRGYAIPRNSKVIVPAPVFSAGGLKRIS